MPGITATQFVYALNRIGRPGGRQLQFLREHYYAPGRALTARLLAEKVGYRSHGGINLCYGKLARQIGGLVGAPGAGLSLLVDFVRPRSVTNREWILIMRPEFADGLKRSAWIRAQIKRGDARSDARQPKAGGVPNMR